MNSYNLHKSLSFTFEFVYSSISFIVTTYWRGKKYVLRLGSTGTIICIGMAWFLKIFFFSGCCKGVEQFWPISNWQSHVWLLHIPTTPPNCSEDTWCIWLPAWSTHKQIIFQEQWVVLQCGYVVPQWRLAINLQQIIIRTKDIIELDFFCLVLELWLKLWNINY